MLRSRVLTAAVGIPLIVAALYVSPVTWAVFCALLGVMMSRELLRLLALQGLEVPSSPVYLASVVFCLLPIDYSSVGLRVFLGENGTAAALALVIGVTLVSLFFVKGSLVRSGAASLFASLYVGFLLSRLAVLRSEADGLALVLIVLVVVWVNDSAAYLVGKRYGKSKLAPLISPGKTVEGAAAGLLFGAAAAPAVALVVPGAPAAAAATLLGLTVAAAAQFGDLFESAIKRTAGVKDSGDILPGHGGLLDRFDSLLFGGAVAYYVARLI